MSADPIKNRDGKWIDPDKGIYWDVANPLPQASGADRQAFDDFCERFRNKLMAYCHFCQDITITSGSLSKLSCARCERVITCISLP